MPAGRTTILTLLICSVFLLVAAAPQVALADKSPKEEALELFEESAKRYQAGKFDEAAELLEKAYALHQEPVLLYNLARAYDGLGEYEKAIEAYEKYLSQSPKAKDRGALERRIQTMKDDLARRKKLEEREQRLEEKQEAPPPPKDDPTPAASSGAGPWPWVVTGVGVAALGAGAIFGLQANGKRTDAEDEPVQRNAAETFRDAESLASTANVFFIAGAVITAGGVTWLILDQQNRKESGGLKLHVTPRSVSLSGHL